MNNTGRNMENLNVCDQSVLDRFVDGELSEEEERVVLQQLEQTEGGWRQCALTFVESRVFEREFQQLSRDAIPPAVRSEKDIKKEHWWNVSSWTMALSVSAVVLLAFTVGTFFPRTTQMVPGSRSVSNAQIASSGSSTSTPEHLVADSLTPWQGQQRSTDQSVDQQPVGTVALDLKTGERIEVPVYDYDRNVANQLLQRSTPLSPEVLHSLKWHEVRRRQEYVPVQLKDGRQVLLPVQELDLVPVNRLAY
jgi:hypothetical protein